MHQCIKFISFWNDTPHVSDGPSVHHQEFKTVHTATKQIYIYIYIKTPPICGQNSEFLVLDVVIRIKTNMR